MPVQRYLGGVTGVGGGDGLAHTMGGFVGGYDVERRLHDVRQVLASFHIFKSNVPPRAFITPSHSWMRRSGKSRWWRSILQEELQYNGLHSFQKIWWSTIWQVRCSKTVICQRSSYTLQLHYR